MTVDQLAETRAFQGLDRETLQAVASRGLFVWVPAGQLVVRRGESGFDFYVILAGDAEVIVGDERVAQLEAGDIFGEMALFEKTKRNADVVASSPMSLLTMSAWNYRTVSKEFPALADRLRELAQSRES